MSITFCTSTRMCDQACRQSADVSGASLSILRCRIRSRIWTTSIRQLFISSFKKSDNMLTSSNCGRSADLIHSFNNGLISSILVLPQKEGVPSSLLLPDTTTSLAVAVSGVSAAAGESVVGWVLTEGLSLIFRLLLASFLLI